MWCGVFVVGFYTEVDIECVYASQVLASHRDISQSHVARLAFAAVVWRVSTSCQGGVELREAGKSMPAYAPARVPANYLPAFPLASHHPPVSQQ
jgi:hypothetical protein